MFLENVEKMKRNENLSYIIHARQTLVIKSDKVIKRSQENLWRKFVNSTQVFKGQIFYKSLNLMYKSVRILKWFALLLKCLVCILTIELSIEVSRNSLSTKKYKNQCYFFNLETTLMARWRWQSVNDGSLLT